MLALEEIYEEYFPKVYNRIFFAVLHKEQAEDLVSAVFLKVARKIDTFDEEKASVKTWIFTIANNTLIDHYRSRKPQQSLDDDDFTYEPAVDFDEQSGLIQNENRRSLYRALSELDARSRNIIAMKYAQDMSVREIGGAMGLNPSTVSTIHVRAIEKLRRALGEDFFES